MSALVLLLAAAASSAAAHCEDRQVAAAVAPAAQGSWNTPFWSCTADTWLAGLQGSDGRVISFLPLEAAVCGGAMVLLPAGRSCDDHLAQCERAGGDNYTCSCLAGAYAPSEPPGGWTLRRLDIEEALQDGGRHNLSVTRCRACPEFTCADVPDGSATVRHAVLGVQVVSMSVTALLVWVVFKQRKSKTIAAGMWTILEMILLGEFLLYATVAVQLLQPSVVRCVLEAWCREIGFVVCYGAIILKLYRILIEFRTRKAHRWVVRDKDLLKYLAGMVVVAHGYMAAWTAASLDFLNDGHDLVVRGRDHGGRHFLTCRPLWWDYVTEVGELLLVVFGLHLAVASRNASSPFGERRSLSVALALELTASTAYYCVRAGLWLQLSPHLHLLLACARSQLASTGGLLCVFLPKLWYEHRRTATAAAGRGGIEAPGGRPPLDAFRAADGSVQDSADLAEVTLADMNPEDIRAELKRLYTQLEVLKNKTIRADNPHISKRRGGRKVAHRRFSLQKKGSREKALHHRQQSQQQQPQQQQQSSGSAQSRFHRWIASRQDATETEASRTPEDSVCSNEGPSAVYGELDRDRP